MSPPRTPQWTLSMGWGWAVSPPGALQWTSAWGGGGGYTVSSPGALSWTLSTGEEGRGGGWPVSSPRGPAVDLRTRTEEVDWSWPVRGALQEPPLWASPSHLLRCRGLASFSLALASSGPLLDGPSRGVCRVGWVPSDPAT